MTIRPNNEGRAVAGLTTIAVVAYGALGCAHSGGAALGLFAAAIASLALLGTFEGQQHRSERVFAYRRGAGRWRQAYVWESSDHH